MLLNLIIASSLTLNAPNFSESELGVGYFEWLTNSILATVIVVGAIVFWARQATRNMQLVPGPTQNLFEAVVEFLYDMLEGIVGKHMVGRVFSLLASLFIFILIANWFGLLPESAPSAGGMPLTAGMALILPFRCCARPRRT